MNRSLKRENLKRILTAFISIPILLVIIIYGGRFYFSLLILCFIALGLNEFFSILLPGSLGFRIPFLLFGVLIPYSVYLRSYELTLSFLSFYLVFLFLLYLFKTKRIPEELNQMGIITLGIMYIPLLFSYLIPLRDLDYKWILFLLSIIFVCDTGALYIGMFFGKHKLYPAISPNKTAEGAIGGIFSGIGGAILARSIFLKELGIKEAIFLGFFLSILGELGDLSESMIKRGGGVKDSGNLFPGHGGVLDRIDSLLFAAPFLYYYLTLRAGGFH